MITIKEVKEKLIDMGKESIGSTIEEVLSRNDELSRLYNTPKRDDLIHEINNTNELIFNVVRRRLGGEPEPWLTAEDCIEFLSDVEFDTEDHEHMAETDGELTAIRELMYLLEMFDEAEALGKWLYN